MATIARTPSATWKAIIRRRGWPTVIKTFRTKRDAADWARRVEDEMVRGVYVHRATSERMLINYAIPIAMIGTMIGTVIFIAAAMPFGNGKFGLMSGI